MNITRTLFISSVLILGLLLSPRLRAEGTLRGRVYDEKNQSLPGSVVKLKGPQGVRQTEADIGGHYWFYGLSPGYYELTFSMDGFATGVQSLVVPSVGATNFNFRMCSGSCCYMVIRPASIMIDTTSSSSSSIYLNRDMLEKFYR